MEISWESYLRWLVGKKFLRRRRNDCHVCFLFVRISKLGSNLLSPHFSSFKALCSPEAHFLSPIERRISCHPDFCWDVTRCVCLSLLLPPSPSLSSCPPLLSCVMSFTSTPCPAPLSFHNHIHVLFGLRWWKVLFSVKYILYREIV